MTKEERKIYDINYRLAHKEEIKEHKTKYQAEHKEEREKYNAEHKEERKEYNAKYRLNHKEGVRDKEKLKEYKTQYYLLRKEKIKKQMADYYLAHREERKDCSNLYYLENKEQIRKNKKDYQNRRKEELNDYHKRYNTERRGNDPLFKMVCNLRTRTSQAFKRIGLNKATKTETLLGADYKTVMRHIESQFVFGMTWEKVGSEIHIDHKTPLAKAKTEKQLIKLCHYTNLQPLWAEDNMRKHDNLNYTTNNLSPLGNC